MSGLNFNDLYHKAGTKAYDSKIPYTHGSKSYRESVHRLLTLFEQDCRKVTDAVLGVTTTDLQ